MQRPVVKGSPAANKKGGTPATAANTPADTPAQVPEPAAGAAPDNKTIRSVGPTFIPAR
jgi:hypothetical protein